MQKFLPRFFLYPMLCSVLAFHAASRADPGFPAGLGAEPAWPDGPTGAFHPVVPGSGAAFYVDAVLGSETGDGSTGDPVKTIRRALELVQAGGSVVVRAGTYREQVMPPALSPVSSRSKPVVIRAEPPDGDLVIIDGTEVVPVVEGMLDGGAGISLYADGGFVVEGFRIQNWSGYGLAIQQSSDTIVRGCTFRDNGKAMADSVDLVVIGSRDARVVGNRFDSATERAVDDRATDSQIAYNFFSGHVYNAIKVGPHPAGQGSRIVHNIFQDNPASQGVLYLHGAAKGVTVQRNLFLRGNLQAIRLDDVEDSLVLLNTVVGFRHGLEIRRLFGCRIAGNILANNLIGVEILSLMVETGLDGNLYYGNTADVEPPEEVEANAIFQDPGFNNPGADDFSLGGGSSARDAGPSDLPVPVGGGSRVDLGAFEIGAGSFPWHYQPLGQVADFTPRFIWVYTDRDPAAKQAWYRVQLDRAPDFDSEDLLESGWQESDAGGWIVPKGFELVEGNWYVRVKLQDTGNRPSPWSDPHLAFTVVSPPDCASQGGRGCNLLDGCDGSWRVASDDPRCCLGNCVPCPDADLDGFKDSACGGTDCNDNDGQIHPNADEVCQDGVDNDCNQLIDLDDPKCGCVDHDRDGYGENCLLGPDCDDSIASVHPGAEELCNNTDDDCNLQIDEGFDIQSDPENCGECGWSCRADQVCDLAACQSSCGGNRTECNRACVDTQGSLSDCGGCGKLCDLPSAGEKCSSGVCLLTVCEAGWVNANRLDQDGCEYRCTPGASGAEVCDNGLDDNCDGKVDEDCGAGGCGCSTHPPPGWLLAFLLVLGAVRKRTVVV